ncbi:hypothetical protein CBE89_02960 [Corynebacterium striatum]|uniref:Uncharacterized protein n=1 Tax=Corynebacterium striatum TaxID=43770 RepID=A0A2Z2IXF2_CORST|nr:hypothetical protein [Corynebacterium striatum]ART20573.1 hypothetical protein CBE89_02960 [Corynebacterium striatum]
MFVTPDNYKGRDTNLDLCNMTIDIHENKENNPLMFRDALVDRIFDLLEPHLDMYGFDLHTVSTVLAMAAEQALRDIDLNRFPYNPGKY